MIAYEMIAKVIVGLRWRSVSRAKGSAAACADAATCACRALCRWVERGLCLRCAEKG